MKTNIFFPFLTILLTLFGILSACKKENDNEKINIYATKKGTEKSSVYNVSPIAGNSNSGDEDGTGPAAKFANITDLAVCAEGILYAYDNAKVKKVSDKGEVRTISKNMPDANPFFNEEGGITVVNGHIYVAGWQSIYRVSTKGKISKFLDLVGDDRPFVNLGDLTSDEQGNIFSVESSGLIKKIVTPKKTWSDYLNSGHLWASITYSKGNIYLLDIQGRVYKVSPAGEPILIYTSESQTGSDIAVAKDGTLYVLDADKIKKINPQGIASHELKDKTGKAFWGTQITLGKNDKVMYITNGLKIGKVQLY